MICQVRRNVVLLQSLKMSTTILIITAIVLVIAAFIIYRLIAVKNAAKKRMREDFDRLKPLIDKLESNEIVSAIDVYPFAANLLTRTNTYLLLKQKGKETLFPNEFYTLEKGAESDMANWLEFPTEMGACPDEIEHVKQVIIDFDGNNVMYHVFKFRINEPHWAAKKGWMFGVVGPFFDDSKPYDKAVATFSRLNSISATTPEEETEWVHKNISMRRN